MGVSYVPTLRVPGGEEVGRGGALESGKLVQHANYSNCEKLHECM